MVEMLRIVLGTLLVASLAAIVVYVVVFFAVTIWVVFTKAPPDPLEGELDRVLAEILGPSSRLSDGAEFVRERKGARETTRPHSSFLEWAPVRRRW
ncbi:MAG: hypothetical protein ACYDEP_00180 [Acidimicrobiales bacterium]|jgi:hypothetical protein|nr:hypothetical protein [Actinomycetota bacterium]